MYPVSFLLLASYVAAISLPRQTIEGTAVVNLNNNTGSPTHLASGILYGIPNTQDQIPDKFYTGIGFNYARAGGAQNPAPARGYVIFSISCWFSKEVGMGKEKLIDMS